MSPSFTTGDQKPDNDDWKRYTVQSQREILSLLKTIQQHKLLINLSFAGGEGIITTILAIDAANKLVILDGAQNGALNQRLSSGIRADFSTSLDGVSISFSSTGITLITHDRRPALRIAMPRELIRLQRRDYFRIMMPIAHPVFCVIPPSPGLNQAPIKANIIDLSCGGVAIAENEGQFSMQIGDVMPDCKLLLHDVGPITVTLEVCNIAQLTLHNGVRKTRLGCRFVDIQTTMPAILQRYIMHLERERLKR